MRISVVVLNAFSLFLVFMDIGCIPPAAKDFHELGDVDNCLPSWKHTTWLNCVICTMFNCQGALFNAFIFIKRRWLGGWTKKREVLISFGSTVMTVLIMIYNWISWAYTPDTSGCDFSTSDITSFVDFSRYQYCCKTPVFITMLILTTYYYDESEPVYER